jgi:amidase
VDLKEQTVSDESFEISRRIFLGACAGAFVTSAEEYQPEQGGVASLVDSNLTFASASTLAAAIRRKRVSSREVIDAHFARIAAVNPRLNAVVRLTEEAARAASRAADEAQARGHLNGPLHGVPFTAKDSLDVAGVVTTAGSKAWANRVPSADATVVARLRSAGAILLGKTNTPEITMSDETDNAVYGRTSNPYDLTRTPGGSSGGAAAIIAAGGSPLDIGSDTSNSIRYPAHNCGIAGIKPTSGRVPRTGHVISYSGINESFTQLGPLARYVEDLALVLPIIAGMDWRDPHVAPVPMKDPKAVRARGLRVVFYTDNGIKRPTAETVEAVRRSVAALQREGALVEERLLPGLDTAYTLFPAVAFADGGASFKRLLETMGNPGYGTLNFLSGLRAVPSSELTRVVERLDDVRSRLLELMQKVDVIVCPARHTPAVPHGATNAPDWLDSYCDTYNVLGWPAAVVRAGTSPEGLPIGVQIVGQPWREDVVLAAAAIIEAQSGGWKRPPM